jgi:hypothetical protein
MSIFVLGIDLGKNVCSLGGLDKTSAVEHAAHDLRWRKPREDGRTGGVIPHWHMSKLLDAAREKEIALTSADFLLATSPSPFHRRVGGTRHPSASHSGWLRRNRAEGGFLMANEVVVKSGRRLPFGDKLLEIRDDGRPVHFVELLMEARQHMGVVSLAFGSVVWDANNEPLAQVASRLRMDLATAQNLHKLLGDMIAAALRPADKAKAN